MNHPPFNNKVIWFKKAKCAGTSFESVAQEAGIIYYVCPSTTLDDLEHPENKIICIREALFPYGGTLIKTMNGKYEFKNMHSIPFKIRRRLSLDFEPKLFMIKKYPEFLDKYPSFAFVRNPYDKFISSWKYLKFTKDIPAEEVINNLPSRKNFHDWIHITQAQVDCISDADGKYLVDQTVYLEDNFNSDIRDILEYVGINNIELPKKNKSKRLSHLEYLDQKLTEKIQLVYNNDFLELGYSFNQEVITPNSPREGIHIGPSKISTHNQG